MKRIVVIAVVMMACPARADDRTDQARRAVDAGLAAQAAGRYDEAIARYQEAYALVPHPDLLFDLGQACRLSGDATSALGYYLRYLDVAPSGHLADDAARWASELAKVNARPPPPDEPTPPPARPAPPSPPIAIARPQIAPRTVRSSHRTRVAVVVASTGAAATIAGLVLGELARTKQAEADALCPSGSCAGDADLRRANALLAQSRMRGDLATPLVGIGAAGLVTGAVLWWTGRSHDRTVAPVIGPAQIGIALGGTF